MHFLAMCNAPPHLQQASLLPGSVQPRDTWPYISLAPEAPCYLDMLMDAAVHLFPCDGLVEVPNFDGPLRDQRLYVGLFPDRLIKFLLEGWDVATLLQDLKGLLSRDSPDGKDLCSRILGVYLRDHGFQDLGVALAVLRRHPDSTETSFFFFFFSSFPPAAIPHPFVGSGLWRPQPKWTTCCPSLSWEADPWVEKEQPSFPPLSDLLGYLPETQSAVYGRYPSFFGYISLRFLQLTLKFKTIHHTHTWSYSLSLTTAISKTFDF